MSNFIKKDDMLNVLIAKVEHSIEVIKNNGFDWDAFNASRGADMDIDIRR